MMTQNMRYVFKIHSSVPRKAGKSAYDVGQVTLETLENCARMSNYLQLREIRSDPYKSCVPNGSQ